MSDMSKANRILQARNRRLADGCCPIHGILMAQERWADCDDWKKGGFRVKCARKDCSIKGVKTTIDGPVVLLPEFAYLLDMSEKPSFDAPAERLVAVVPVPPLPWHIEVSQSGGRRDPVTFIRLVALNGGDEVVSWMAKSPDEVETMKARADYMMRAVAAYQSV